MKIIIPAYSYPTPESDYWFRVTRNKPDMVVVNPSSGPGLIRDENYASMILRLLSTGIKVLGYVSTSYAKVPVWQAELDRAKYNQLYYPLHGTFYDEQHDDANRLFYYAALRRVGEVNVFNPGAFCSEAYASLNSIICTYETDYDTYMARKPEEWMKRTRTYHIVYNVTETAQMRKVVAEAKLRNASYVWICTDNRYDTLPPYFEEMSLIVK